jgi:hypothetical protein
MGLALAVNAVLAAGASAALPELGRCAAHAEEPLEVKAK